METIKSRLEFEKVFSHGRRLSHKLVRMTVLRCDEGGLGRVAFVAPRRLGNAVFRNRCKRVLREAARMSELPPEGTQIILFATRLTHESSPAEVSLAVLQLLKRLNGKQGA
ncbi:ribonuclease P protein component [Olsenella urininfantis]|uniref:ribonuclease P protein component n=1 Tax=Olsenella urininfantis TaxID=1871033 RepID=UPI000986FF18|nr:ribonuclease P protein component [Olsenella urininfantis]